MQTETLKIGILSDPHGRLELQRDALELLREKGARYLLHAGDFCSEEALRQLHEYPLAYAAVFGNNDRSLLSTASGYRIETEPYYLRIQSLKIKLMHLPYFLSPDCDLVIYGHTHRFAVEQRGSTLYLNPGEICAREKNTSECALLEATSSQWRVEHYRTEPGARKWTATSYRFPR